MRRDALSAAVLVVACAASVATRIDGPEPNFIQGPRLEMEGSELLRARVVVVANRPMWREFSPSTFGVGLEFEDPWDTGAVASEVVVSVVPVDQPGEVETGPVALSWEDDTPPPLEWWGGWRVGPTVQLDLAGCADRPRERVQSPCEIAFDVFATRADGSSEGLELLTFAIVGMSEPGYLGEPSGWPRGGGVWMLEVDP